MIRNLSLLAFALGIVTGCKDKGTAKRSTTDPGGSAAGSAATSSAPLAASLPVVSGGASKLLLEYVSGLVQVRADGALAVAPSPIAAADPFAGVRPAQLASLAEALGLPPPATPSESFVSPGDAVGAEAPADPRDAAFAQLGHPVTATGAPTPLRRLTSAFSISHPDDVSGGVVVFADAKAPATALIHVLAQTGGFIAVQRGGEVGALSLAIDRHVPQSVAPSQAWIEVRVGAPAGSLEVARVPGAATRVPAVAKLPEVIGPLGVTAADVLVGKATTVQELVGVVEQLRTAGIVAIGVGEVSEGPELAARGSEGARVLAWAFAMSRDLASQAPFRAALDATLGAMRECYQKVVAETPDAGGTAQLQVTVAPDAKVRSATAAGVAPAISSCATTVLKAASFPPSREGARFVANVAFVPR